MTRRASSEGTVHAPFVMPRRTGHVHKASGSISVFWSKVRGQLRASYYVGAQCGRAYHMGRVLEDLPANETLCKVCFPLSETDDS